jgi:hypothetical protein
MILFYTGTSDEGESMPLSKKEEAYLKKEGCRNVTQLTTRNGHEFYIGDCSRAEVKYISDNKFFVARQLQSTLSEEELRVYSDYRVEQLLGYSSLTPLAAGVIIGGMTGGVANAALHNPELDKEAELLRQEAEIRDGRKSNPSKVSRRQWVAGLMGITVGVASDFAAKGWLDKNAANSDDRKVAYSPVLAGAIQKVADLNQHKPVALSQGQDMPRRPRWQDSVVVPRDPEQER